MQPGLSGKTTRKIVDPPVGQSGHVAHTEHMGTPRVQVGVDLASVGAVRTSIERFGDRYLRRCYTDHELATTQGREQARAASLAARFAAKEATVKALGAGSTAFDWRSIEVQRRPDGGCRVALYGALATMAHQEGIEALSVALTHEGDMAAAVVVALRSSDGDEEE